MSARYQLVFNRFRRGKAKANYIFHVTAHVSTRFRPGTSYHMRASQLAKRVGPFSEDEPARQVSQPVFNPPHIILNSFLSKSL